MSRRQNISAILMVGIAGCTVGPNYQPPQVHVNGSYQEIATTAATQASRAEPRAIALVEWWTTFNDPQLNDLIDRAARSNFDLIAATERIREARAERAYVFGGAYPQVDLSGSAQKFRVSKNGIPIPITGSSGSSSSSGGANGITGGIATPSIARPNATSSSGSSSGGASSLFSKSELDLYQLGFDASWEIDLFGGIRRGVEEANAELAASIEDRRDVLITLLSEVARDYISLRGAQRQQAIAEENLTSQQETLRITQEKFKAGFTTDLDVARAAAEVATTASQIPTLVNQSRQMIHALGVLLGQDPASLMQELTAARGIPVLPAEVPVGLPAELLRRRPDIRRAERQLAAATANVGVATAELYPRFSLSGTFAFQSTKPKSLFDYDSRTFSLGPAIDWQIFNAGRLRANIDVQNSRQRQALATYQKTVLTALQDVENALSSYSTEQLRHLALQDAVSANRTAVALANQQYDRGVADFLAVLDAQRNLYSAETELAESDQTVAINLVSLYKALGGGWQIDSRE